ncbi:MAG: NfeD family protein [Planctomycetota bacterium]
MDAIFAGTTGLEKIYLVCAIVGGILFAIRLLFFFIGGAGDADVDADVDIDVDVDIDADIDADVDYAEIGQGSDVSFHLLSFQGITGFFVMFGLVGFALVRQGNVGSSVSIIGALAAGFLTLYVIAKMMSFMKGLQSSGNVDITNAIGQEGSVYLTIPPGGIGKVQIRVSDRLREFEATSEDKQELKTGENIKVVKIAGSNLLVVKKA